MVELEHAQNLLERLDLPTAAITLDACLSGAAKSESTYLSFLFEFTMENRESGAYIKVGGALPGGGEADGTQAGRGGGG